MTKKEKRELKSHIKSLYYIQNDEEFKREFHIVRKRINEIPTKRQFHIHLKSLLTESLHRHVYREFDYCVCRDVKKSLELIKNR